MEIIMNIYQSRKSPKLEARRLSVLDVRPGMRVALAADSHRVALLPENLVEALGGGFASVLEVTGYGNGQVRVKTAHVRALHPSGTQVFIVPGGQSLLVSMPETVPVPFTPACLALQMAA
jgi:hypothetical protein